jgi:RecA/RadA recombinase
MAKKTITTDSLFKEMKKLNPFSSSLADSDFALPSEYISTGNYILNATLTGSLRKGIPNNRSICLAGESGAGKTFVLLNLCKQAQDMGYHIIYYDTEGAVDRDMALKFGINPNAFQHEPISDIDTFRTSITTVTKTLIDVKATGGELPKIFIALDSLGMLATQKEIDDAMTGSDKSDFTRAKKIRSLFRIITNDLTGCKVPFVLTNHVGVNIGGYGDPVVMGGGDGLKYSASIISCYSKAKLKEDKNDAKRQTGMVLTSKCWKNRFAQPHTVKVHIDFSKGMNAYFGLHEFMSWENCGIGRGNIYTEKQYEKFTDAEKTECLNNNYKFEHDDKTFYFFPKATAQKYVVKHLGRALKASELFVPEVWEPIIDELDDKVIKPMFEFGHMDEDFGSEVEDLIADSEDATNILDK